MIDPNEIEVDLKNRNIKALLVAGVWYELAYDKDTAVPDAFVGPVVFGEDDGSVRKDRESFANPQPAPDASPWSLAITAYFRGYGRCVFPLSAVQGIQENP